MLSLWSSKTPLGVDLGSSNLKIVELVPANPVPKLNQYLIREVQSDLIKQLAEIKAEYDFQTNKVTIGVEGSDLIIRQVTFPVMSEQDLDQVISLNAEDSLPLPIEEVELDYEILERREEELVVMLVAVKKKPLLDKIKVLEEAGFKVVSVAASPLTLKHILSSEKISQEDLVVIDIGAKVTEIIVLKEGKFSFRRGLDIGGRDFTVEVSRKKELSLYEAKNYKSNQQIKEDTVSQSTTRLKQKIKHSLGYNSVKISQLLMTGGVANLNPLVKRLDHELDIQVGILDSIDLIQFDVLDISPHLLRQKLPQLSVSLGLALRGIECYD
ncbi:type IV pilus assembly protein PilM [Halanaerocella petrolearia]